MLLAVDIGNTNIVVALFHNTEIVQEWRIHSDSDRTSDEYASILRSLFRDTGVTAGSINTSILSSVVPLLYGPFISLLESITGTKPFIVGPAMYSKLPITIPESAIHEIGTDLVCNAVEAWSLYHQPIIITDFGTALTFTVIDAKGQIQGVAIAPGIKTAINSLFNNTAQLPSVALEAPETSLGTNTIYSIQAGIILGYKGLVESLVSRMKSDLAKQTNCSEIDIKVIATGGLNSVLKPITACIDDVDKSLTLKGLYRIACILYNKKL